MIETKHLPTTAHYRDAGMTDKAYGRTSTHAEQWNKKRAIANAMRPPVSCCEEQILPDEFLSEQIEKVRLHLGRGHFAQAKATIDQIEKAWQLRVTMQSQAATGPTAEKLAWHVSWLFDDRTCNIIEDVCCGTVGALLDAFPAEFIEVPNVGPLTV